MTNVELTRRAAMATGAAVCCGAAAGCGGSSKPKAKPVDFTMPASQVPVGDGYLDKKNQVIVTQLKKGEFKAFSSVCTHEGCDVSGISAKALVCPCHSSRFDPSTGAVIAGPATEALPTKAVIAGPATEALPTKKVTVQGDQLHITG